VTRVELLEIGRLDRLLIENVSATTYDELPHPGGVGNAGGILGGITLIVVIVSVDNEVDSSSIEDRPLVGESLVARYMNTRVEDWPVPIGQHAFPGMRGQIGLEPRRLGLARSEAGAVTLGIQDDDVPIPQVIRIPALPGVPALVPK